MWKPVEAKLIFPVGLMKKYWNLWLRDLIESYDAFLNLCSAEERWQINRPLTQFCTWKVQSCQSVQKLMQKQLLHKKIPFNFHFLKKWVHNTSSGPCYICYDTLLDLQSRRATNVEKGKEMEVTRIGCKQNPFGMDSNKITGHNVVQAFWSSKWSIYDFFLFIS